MRETQKKKTGREPQSIRKAECSVNYNGVDYGTPEGAEWRRRCRPFVDQGSGRVYNHHDSAVDWGNSVVRMQGSETLSFA